MYNAQQIKKAISFNTIEVLPSGDQLDKEIQILVNNANSSGQPIRHYIGFEISGQIHIGGGLFQMLQAVELQKAGVEIVLWMADYHTWLNSKLDGKIATIKKVAREYFAPVMLKTFEVAGGNPELVKVIFNYDDYRRSQDDKIFWDYEFQCDRELSLNRVLRSLSITGKTAGDDVDYQLTRYPGMQAADVFWLQAHIAQSGLDQRKIYVSTRDIAFKLDDEFQLKIANQAIKPICTFSTLLLGLEAPTKNNEGQIEIAKMSKSKPDSCIFVNDNQSEIARKLKKAYCPMIQQGQTMEEVEQEQANNPILNWCENLIFAGGRNIILDRPDKFGGIVEYSNYQDLKNDYYKGLIHPMDLKNAVSLNLSNWLAPVIQFVQDNPTILDLVKNAKK